MWTVYQLEGEAMTYRQKLERCGYHLNDDVTEEEAEEKWNELADAVDIWITRQFLATRQKEAK
jgi:hypothetical protein